uniref:C-like opsin n=1 Tax=Tripedalia cystophora TaxID=6141 RepID=A0A059NTD3_TRICY|nr:c-like opsin [Tripedalia cystophora]
MAGSNSCSLESDFLTEFQFLGYYIGLSALLSSILNGLVIFSLWKSMKNIDTCGLMLLSLSVNDFLSPTFGYPMAAYASLQHKWIYGDDGLQMVWIISAFSGFGSLHHLMLLSGERFISITKPLKKEQLLSNNRTRYLIIFCWSSSLVWATFPLVGWNGYTLEGLQTMCSVNWQSKDAVEVSYIVSILVCCFLIPQIGIIYFNACILLEIRCMKKKARIEQGVNSSIYRGIKSISKQQSLMVAFMVLAFNLSWLPYAFTSIYTLFINVDKMSPVTTSIPAVFTKSATVLNPIVYFLFNKNYRKLFKAKVLARAVEVSRVN